MMLNEPAADPAAPHAWVHGRDGSGPGRRWCACLQPPRCPLSEDLNRSLRQQAQDLVVPVSQRTSSLTELAGTGFIERGESFAELLTPNGGVLQATETLNRQPLLSPAEAAAAANGLIFLDRPTAPGLNEPARLLAVPVTRAGKRVILVVGDTRENGLEVLRRCEHSSWSDFRCCCS